LKSTPFFQYNKLYVYTLPHCTIYFIINDTYNTEITGIIHTSLTSELNIQEIYSWI